MIRPTKEQQQHVEEKMAQADKLLGDEKASKAVGQLIMSMTGHIVSLIEEEDEEKAVSPTAAFFALGMVANALSTIVAQLTESDIAENKKVAMIMVTYGMKQTVIAKAVEPGEGEQFFKMHTMPEGPLQ